MKAIIPLSVACAISSICLSTLGNAQEPPGINCLAYLQADKTLWREGVKIMARDERDARVARSNQGNT